MGGVSAAREEHPGVDVTVVIPCYNGALLLPRQLAALAAQVTSATYQVLVADNRSTDTSARVVREELGPASLVDASRVRGINHARNCGVRASDSPLLLFCDVDDMVHPGWIEAYWTAFQAGACLMGGPVRRVVPGGVAVWQRRFSDTLNFLPWPTGANFGVAREVVDVCGAFDENYRGGGDETEFAWRCQLAGFPLTYVENAAIDYHMRETTTHAFHQNRAFGRSHVQLFVAFRDRGMRRRTGDGLVNLAEAVVRWARRPDARAGRVVVAQLGILAGRVAKSLKERTLYV